MSDSEEEYIEDEWTEITGHHLEPSRTMSITMAGGSDKAWDYVLEWKNDDDETPAVYIDAYPFDSRQLCESKTLILKHEGSSTSIRLWDKYDDLPESTDDCSYCYFLWPGHK